MCYCRESWNSESHVVCASGRVQGSSGQKCICLEQNSLSPCPTVVSARDPAPHWGLRGAWRDRPRPSGLRDVGGRRFFKAIAKPGVPGGRQRLRQPHWGGRGRVFKLRAVMTAFLFFFGREATTLS